MLVPAGFFFCLSAVLAQVPGGRPIIRHFPPDVYGASAENWCMVQDARGFLYTANGDGVLEFDGVRWRLIPVANKSIVRWLSQDLDGTIYVCAQGEFGRLQPDPAGRMYYATLMNRQTHPEYDLTEIWEATATSDGVYFRMYNHLVRYRNGLIKAWSASKFDVVFSVRDTVYTRMVGVGLHRVTGDSLVMVPGGAFFADLKINGILPYDESRILVATRAKGLFVYDGGRVTALPTSADAYLASQFIYDARRLPGGDFVFGTIRGGIVIVDRTGQVRQILDRSRFLPADGVGCVFVDRDGALWVGYRHNGLSRIEIQSPFSLYDPTFGWDGRIFSLTRQNGRLLLSTSRGVYRMSPDDGPVLFEPLITNSPYYYGFTHGGSDVLVATGNGTFHVKKNDCVRITDQHTRDVTALDGDSTVVLAGLPDGIMRIVRSPGGSWRSDKKLEGISEYAKEIVGFADHTVWVGTDFQGALRLDFHGDWRHEPSVERFNEKNGLPVGRVHLLATPDGPLFGTTAGWYRFNTDRKFFDPMTRSRLSQLRGEDLLSLNRARWMMDPEWLPNFTDKPHLKRIWPLQAEKVFAYVRDEKGVEWFGGDHVLVRYDSRMAGNVRRELATVIPMVTVFGEASSVAMRKEGVPVVFVEAGTSPGLRFEFALPAYEESGEFQWKLDGFEEDWSGWSRATSREYVHLPDGWFTFRVRGRDVYGNVGADAVVPFRISPPLYATWWAYALYATLFLLMVSAVIRIRVRFLERRNAELQALADKRTRELRDAQAQILQSEKMAAVGQMVAGVAHEINNPLTFIMPNLDYIQNQIHKLIRYFEATDDAERHALRTDMIRGDLLPEMLSAIESSARGGARIRDIVQNLRTFTHFDEATTTAIDIDRQLDHVHALFFSETKDIVFEKKLAAGKVIKGQARELNQCFINVLDNAVQAIREAEAEGLLGRGLGMITMQTESTEHGAGVRIVISDNGVGMKPDVRSRIFEPFYTTRPVGSGRGLGLSEVYAVITRHKGTIEVRSEPEHGTEVVITLY